MPARNGTRKAFSLIELVIVIIIMGVISAIAIPRMVRGAEGADVTGLQADLAVLRGAIEMYKYEHSAFPTVLNFEAQLADETDAAGGPGTDYGPYVVKIPTLKTGVKKGETGVAAAGDPPAFIDSPAGWLYNETTGEIWANDANHLDK
jgi:general secretion pathway protein G